MSKTIAVIGPRGVGKTSLCERYINNTFSTSYITTFASTVLNAPLTKIWDTAVDSRFDKDLETVKQQSNGYILCFDINYPETFDKMIQLWSSFPTVDSVVIAATKCDANISTSITTEWSNTASVMNAKIIKTSSKDTINIGHVFDICLNGLELEESGTWYEYAEDIIPNYCSINVNGF